MQSKISSSSRTASPISAFQYFLWRRHTNTSALHGFYPEIIATDGIHVRRMIALNRQIFYQEFDDSQLVLPIIRRVEAGANNGIPLVGYSMMSAQDSMAILQTGTTNEPGWLAFPDLERTLTGQHSTLPPTNTNDIGLRLLAGGEITWENREMQLYAALEQRQNTGSMTQQLPNLFDHCTNWTLHATYKHKNEITPIRLTRRNTPNTTPSRINAHRIETRFTLDSNMFREFSQKPSFQIWFELQLNRTLFCLPEQWNSTWIAVNPSMNP